MKFSMLLLFSCFLLNGCVVGGDFRPKTAEGATCKVDCAKDMANCRGSSYTCDRAASTCMMGCQDLDAIKSK